MEVNDPFAAMTRGILLLVLVIYEKVQTMRV